MLKTLFFIENFLLSPPISYFTWGALFFLISKLSGKNQFFSGYLIFTYLVSTPIFTTYVMNKLEKDYNSYHPNSNIAQAIVVLGGGLNYNAWEYGGISVSGGELERLRHAAKLHTDTNLPILVTGGDPLETGYQEAFFMKKILENEFHVPVKWIEDKSKTTKENIMLSSTILKENNIKSAYIVTHSWHMKRALSLTKIQNDISYLPSGCSSDISQNNKDKHIKITDFIPSITSIQQLKIIIHELGGKIINI
jgi:uncharacterized SAM-binding protein YcdF (DUF218 family)